MERMLRSLGAEEVCAAHWERNWVLDHDGELESAHKVLRVREQRASDGSVLGARLTAKAPLGAALAASAMHRGVKERVECETAVENAVTTIELLALLGFEPVRRYDKVRHTFRIENHEVVLDHTPIGDYVEVEGGDPRAVADELQLDLERTSLLSYLSLYDLYCQRQPEAPWNMTFARGGAPAGFAALEGTETVEDPRG